MAALLAGICSFGYAQARPDYMLPTKSNEKVIGTVSLEKSHYFLGDYSEKGWSPGAQLNDWYRSLFEKAKKEFSNETIDIREMNVGEYISSHAGYKGPAVGKVVTLKTSEDFANEGLPRALNKALRNVREGSRLAIDQVTVISCMDRETMKDHLLDVLLDKGYKVVAKEYLEKLYEEQQNQQSGIYNENTTVKENNFSAVGYYINVKVTETSLRVQVVNVSTGEYEGNATVNF